MSPLGSIAGAFATALSGDAPRNRRRFSVQAARQSGEDNATSPISLQALSCAGSGSPSGSQTVIVSGRVFPGPSRKVRAVMVRAMATNATAPTRAKSLVSTALVPEHLRVGGNVTASWGQEPAELFTRLRFGGGCAGAVQRLSAALGGDYGGKVSKLL
jgi:hypothetical protein